MATAAKIEDVKPSRHAMALLEALVNASNDEYDERLAEICDYIAACENNANITALQSSIVWNLRSQENQRKKIKQAMQKLTRFDERGAPADLGDWLSFYDVMQVVR